MSFLLQCIFKHINHISVTIRTRKNNYAKFVYRLFSYYKFKIENNYQQNYQQMSIFCPSYLLHLSKIVPHNSTHRNN